MKALAVALALCAGCTDGALPLPLPGKLSLVRFAAIGDYGEDGINERHVAHLVKSWKPDFIITLGDNNYASGEESTIDANIGKYYHEYIGGYHGRYGAGSDGNRFWPSMGNHEFYSPEIPPWKPWLDYFPDLPGNKRYYDVDQGLVHLFVVDSDEHEPDGATATSFQALDLQARMAASNACFKIVYFHHPPYSSGNFEVPRMRWPFQAWGADAVLSGHEHFYERFDIHGLPYFVNGLGGDDKFGFLEEQPGSRAHFNADFGAMLITANSSRIRFQFFTVSGELIDSLTVAKSCASS